MEGYKRYMEDDVLTNHPIENVILIYEKAIQKFRIVKKYYSEFKFSLADEQLEKLEEIFMELNMAVNEEADLELAENLYRLYDYILRKIYEIKQFRNAESIPSIESNLKDLIDGYKGALKNIGHEQQQNT